MATLTTLSEWDSIATIAGGAVAVVGAIGGLMIARHYARRASPTVSATAYPLHNGAVISVRAKIRNAGVLRLHLDRRDKGFGAVVKVTPTLDDGRNLVDGNTERRRIMEKDVVDGGESAATTTLFEYRTPPSGCIGWRVSLVLELPRLALKAQNRKWSWIDRTFVPWTGGSSVTEGREEVAANAEKEPEEAEEASEVGVASPDS